VNVASVPCAADLERARVEEGGRVRNRGGAAFGEPHAVALAKVTISVATQRIAEPDEALLQGSSTSV